MSLPPAEAGRWSSSWASCGLPLDLDQYRVGQLPTLFLVHDYLSEDEQQRLLGEITSCRAKWTAVSGRRLQNHGGSVLGTGLVQASMPSWLQGLVTRLSQGTGIYGGALANHVLINSYSPGRLRLQRGAG